MDRHEQFGLESGPGRNAAAHAYVAVAARDIQHLKRRMQVHVTSAVSLPPAAQPWNQPAGGKKRGRGHFQRFGPGSLRQSFEGLPDPVEAAAQDRQQRGAGLGQLDAPVVAAEQFEAGLRFEALDLLADGAMRDVEFQRRGRKALVARRRLEGTQPAQGKILTFHRENTAFRNSNTGP
jgi:hypothetical protein